MNIDEIDKLSDSRTEPVIRKVIARAFYNAGFSGEFNDIEDFLLILFGRPVPYIFQPPDVKPLENSPESNNTH
jgi:hypothetical protein